MFDVPEAGEYVLNVKDVGSVLRYGIHKLRVNHVACVLRGNALRINSWICGAGCASLVAGVVGFLACFLKRVPDKKARRTKQAN